jgi:hypothetical protein
MSNQLITLGLVSISGTSTVDDRHYGARDEPNARLHLLPEAGATQERTLEAVRCKPFIGIESCFQ